MSSSNGNHNTQNSHRAVSSVAVGGGNGSSRRQRRHLTVKDLKRLGLLDRPSYENIASVLLGTLQEEEDDDNHSHGIHIYEDDDDHHGYSHGHGHGHHDDIFYDTRCYYEEYVNHDPPLNHQAVDDDGSSSNSGSSTANNTDSSSSSSKSYNSPPLAEVTADDGTSQVVFDRVKKTPTLKTTTETETSYMHSHVIHYPSITGEATNFVKLQSSPISVFDFPGCPPHPNQMVVTSYQQPPTASVESSSTSPPRYSSSGIVTSNIQNSTTKPQRRGDGPVDLDDSVVSSVVDDDDEQEVDDPNGKGGYGARSNVNGIVDRSMTSNVRRRGDGPVDLDESVVSSVEDNSEDDHQDQKHGAEPEDRTMTSVGADLQLVENSKSSRQVSEPVDLDEAQDHESSFNLIWKEHEDEFLIWKQVNPQQGDEDGNGHFQPTMPSQSSRIVTARPERGETVQNPKFVVSSQKHPSSPRSSGSSIFWSLNSSAIINKIREHRLNKNGPVEPDPVSSVAHSDEGRTDVASIVSVDTYGFSVTRDSTTRQKWSNLGGDDGGSLPSNHYHNDGGGHTDAASIESVDSYGYSLGGNSATRKKWSSLGGGIDDANESVDSYGFKSIPSPTRSSSSVRSKSSIKSKSSNGAIPLSMKPGGPELVAKIYKDLDGKPDVAPSVTLDASKEPLSQLQRGSDRVVTQTSMDEKPWVPSLNDPNNHVSVLESVEEGMIASNRKATAESLASDSEQKVSTLNARNLRSLRLRSGGNKVIPVNDHTGRPGSASLAVNPYLTDSVGISGVIQTHDSDNVSEITVNTKDRRSSTMEYQPSTKGNRPTTKESRPSPKNRQPSIKDRQASIKDRQPSTKERRNLNSANQDDHATLSSNESSNKYEAILNLQEVAGRNEQGPPIPFDASVKTPPNLYQDSDEWTSDGEEGSRYWDDVSSIGLTGVEALAAAERRREAEGNAMMTAAQPCTVPVVVRPRVDENEVPTKKNSPRTMRAQDKGIFRSKKKLSKISEKSPSSHRKELPDLEINPTFSTVWADDHSDVDTSTYDVEDQVTIDHHRIHSNKKKKEVSNTSASSLNETTDSVDDDKLESPCALTTSEWFLVIAILVVLTVTTILAVVYVYAVAK